jgi:biopolymer transport protein ExbB
MPGIERNFSTMAAWISAAPLLGLLGTVTGMVATFEVITKFGVGNPTLTAEGISVALLTTQAGLTVAFPGVILQNALLNRRRQVMAQLMHDGEQLISHIQRHAGGR